ncbi:DUF2946 domain-containing protein [Achromobacter sp. DH1f]|uniref:DUF2946 domain-containing protein n=1 Tax=Achromobacter sp. DH1f TaxID=1397275 RepID=UPI000468E4C8|nr:DUF2946 domain-containing protein [Achromobacter sp. DH1f]
MHLAHFLNRGYAWIALVAILWASLVPSLAHGSHAEGGTSRQVTVDYCAPDGKSSLTIDVQGDDTPADHAAHHGDSTHCPFCRNPQADIGILPAPLLVLRAPPGRVSYPALFYRASHPLYAWSAAQPRAPPAA